MTIPHFSFTQLGRTFIVCLGFALPFLLNGNVFYAAPPTGVDLDVTHINRAEMYDRYIVDYPNGRPTLRSGTENDKRWPDPGETVTFTAHVTNKGTLNSGSFSGQWLVDGVVVQTVSHGSLSAGTSTTFTYNWAWDHQLSADGQRILGDHTIAFKVDPTNSIAETFENNNQIEDLTNAYSFHFYIQQEIYDGYEVPRLAGRPYSAEDWLQYQVTAMNNLFETEGVPTRVRINKITITENNPSVDTSHDGAWFYRDADYRDPGVSYGYDPATDIDWSLIHELAHQLGLIDLYQYDSPLADIQVKETSGDNANVGYRWEDGGLMHGVERFLAPHTKFGAESTWGYRRGYYGEYQFSMPENIFVRIFDNTGNVVPNTEVTFFQRNGDPDWNGNIPYDNTPEFSGTTDNFGFFRLPNRSIGGELTTKTGFTQKDNPFGIISVVGNQNSFLIRITKDSHEEFAWLHVTDINEASVAGGNSYFHDINTHIAPADAPDAPILYTPKVEGNMARLCWSSVNGATEYTVYGITYPSSTYEEVVTLGSSSAENCYDTQHNISTVYAVTATDNGNRESGFSNTEWTPKLVSPIDLKEDADGNIIILDPQNGQALLRQNTDGKYLQNFGSVHFHLEGSRYLANDADDNLAFSYLEDGYTDYLVRLTDAEVQPTGGFADVLNEPTGIDMWGNLSDCSAVQEFEYQSGNSLLLTRFENNLTDEGGVSPTSYSDISYVNGRFGQGAYFSETARLSYATNHINLAQGSIQFWVKPAWNGNDTNSYFFFEAGFPFNNGMRIQKDGANNLRFIVWDGSSESGVGHNISDWVANEWHLVGVKWQGGNLSLYVDGIKVSETANGSFPSSMSGALHIGSAHNGSGNANATLDDFLISNTAGFQNESCNFWYVVADNGNNLLRVFDREGNLVDSHSGLNNPQGVAVAPDGTIWVVDSGNNRIRTFSWDGTYLDTENVITADFNAPTGIDIASNGEVAVSDTGNNVVKLLNSAGTLLRVLDTPVQYEGALNQPRGVLYHSNGGVYVADRGNARVVRMKDDVKSVLVSPEPDSTLTSDTMSVTVSDVGADSYYLYVGSVPGGRQFFSGYIPNRTATVTDLPTDGSTVYVRVWTYRRGSYWKYNDYVVTAHTEEQSQLSELLSPPPTSTVTTSSMNVIVSDVGASSYYLYVGSTPGGRQYFSGFIPNRTATVTGLPRDDSSVYIRVWTLHSGESWQHIDTYVITDN